MQFVGPFTFNGVRFALGSLSLLPLIYIRKARRNERSSIHAPGKTFLFGLLAGTVLFLGASLQQIGIVYTTAGKCGFITGLYVVLVPISGLIWGQKAGWSRWIGAVLAVSGLYFLSVAESFTISKGDSLVLLSAFFWTAHVQILGRFSPRADSIRLACIQFAVCSLLSLILAVITETIELKALLQAGIPILYGGLCSVGIAYTLQVVVQKAAHPAHAAIVLSLEGVFAVFGGWLILGESLSARGILGCAMMLAGMIFSQIAPRNTLSGKGALGC